MRRTLAVLATTAAFLAPAGAASATTTEAEVPSKTNASCNSHSGELNNAAKFADNEHGNSPRRGAGTCASSGDGGSGGGSVPIY